MECSLMLTTLSEETFQVSLSVAKFDRFEDLEDQVMDCLVSTLLGRPSVATPVLLVFLDPKMKATHSPENAI